MCTDENTVRWVKKRLRRVPDSPRTRSFQSTSAYIAARHSPSSTPNVRSWIGNTASVKVAASTRRKKRTGSAVPARRPDWKGGPRLPHGKSEGGLSSEWATSGPGLTASWPTCLWASYPASNMMRAQTPADVATANAHSPLGSWAARQPAWSLVKITPYCLLTSVTANEKYVVSLLVLPLIQVSSIWRYISFFRDPHKEDIVV